LRQNAQSLLAITDDQASLERLQAEEERIRARIKAAIDGETWRCDLRGRDILSRFSAALGGIVPYRQLRNLIVARMRQEGFQPPGMRRVLDEIARFVP
jgi:hypothetical protein